MSDEVGGESGEVVLRMGFSVDDRVEVNYSYSEIGEAKHTGWCL